MKSLFKLLILNICFSSAGTAGEIIPFNEDNWEIEAKAFVLENYKGKDAIYIHQGSSTLKNVEFLNGTIEFDVFLTERQSFPGVGFRQFDKQNQEQFFLRPHLSGKPDANQAASAINGLVAWQLYFGPRYSFSYDYKFDDWTHVKLVAKGEKAQVFLDYADKPNLSWIMKHAPQAGSVNIGGSFAPMHYANFQISHEDPTLVDFKLLEATPIEGVVESWRISDKFLESQLAEASQLEELISQRNWEHSVTIDETNAANISWVVSRYGSDGNTVFARLIIDSKVDQTKLFDFGYSDRVVAILNGQAIYRGDNKWRTRDYRYLGTVGFFDSIYLNLKKGQNTLLMAVSEDFGGWGITGKFSDRENLKVSH